jgi:RNA polymerase sigma-70 factor (ECF subfamily)
MTGAMSQEGHTQILQGWLDQLRQGDTSRGDEVRAAILAHAGQRLEQLARRMLRKFPHVGRWEQTGDVLQNAMLRLHRALDTVQPESPQRFYGLAATQIRRELIDLARHHFGPEGEAAHHHTDAIATGDGPPEGLLAHASDTTGEPATLIAWAEFHEQVEALPEALREVFNLLWYEGMNQRDAGAILNVSERTIKNRWRDAKILLRERLAGESPE